jgi:hypothetical protein
LRNITRGGASGGSPAETQRGSPTSDFRIFGKKGCCGKI